MARTGKGKPMLWILLFVCGAPSLSPRAPVLSIPNAQEAITLADDVAPDPGSTANTSDKLVSRSCKARTCTEHYRRSKESLGEGGVAVVRKGDQKLLVPSEYVPHSK